MPKIIDYPRASLKNCLELAKDLDALGGEAALETLADKANRKISGAFNALVSSSAKYGLLDVAKGRASIAQLYRDYKLAYSVDDEIQALKSAFLNVPVFERIASQFQGKEVPIQILDRILIREHGVAADAASRVSGYFLEGAGMAGLLNDNHVLALRESEEKRPEKEPETATVDSRSVPENSSPKPFGGNRTEQIREASAETAQTTYSIAISGPGMDFTMAIKEHDDLEIVQVMLRKISRKLADGRPLDNLKPPEDNS